MENLHFNGDEGIDDLNSNKSTISGSNTFIYWSKALEEHFPSHFINKPLVSHFGVSEINVDAISDSESLDFSEKWANSYLKKLGIFLKKIFNNKFFIKGYVNCLPLVLQYKTLIKKKEDLVQLCVNKIEEIKERQSLSSENEKPPRKIVMEEVDLDMSSHKNESNSKFTINLEIPLKTACQICYSNSEKIKVGFCSHSFCRDCLKQYIENLINIGQVYYKMNLILILNTTYDFI